ncbi:MAG: right-handed parallel beta-helix repeat-containing protein [Planctomycetaceae bacterium]|nr:right-handed parallel beta-helix repeat-containing protein [Planctomycetaceae bacterium]
MNTQPTRLYVSPQGRDAWTGLLSQPNADRTDGPLASLPAARDVVRRLRAAGTSGAVEVQIAQGLYSLSEPLTLEPQDGGRDEASAVTYRGVPGARPVISGGRRITGWKKTAAGAWTVELPQARSGAWYFTQLFVNGRRADRTRWPSEGLLPIEPFNAAEVKNIDCAENRQAFRFRSGDIKGDWKNLSDVEVVVCQIWTDSRLHIESVDAKDGVVHFTGPGWRALNWTTGYYVENIAEALKAPGSWYLDRAGGVLTYLPLAGEDPATAEVVAPVLETLVRIDGDWAKGNCVRHLRFEGLSFQHAAWTMPPQGFGVPQAEIQAPAAIVVAGIEQCSFRNCELAHLGGWGIELAAGCKDNAVVGNSLYDLGSGAIRAGRPTNPASPAELTCRTTITDNTVGQGSLVYLGAAAIWIGHSSENLVAHNDVQGDYHWAVSVGWAWSYWTETAARDNIVELNHCHHIGSKLLGSHAAIYALGIQPGTCFRNNLIHDVAGWPDIPHVPNGCGIILDNSCAGITVENNIAYDCDGGGICVNFNVFGDIIQNNIFAYGRRGQLSRYGDPTPAGEWMPNPILFRRNIVVWDQGKLFFDPDWPNFGLLWDSNLYWHGGKDIEFMKYNLAQWQERHMDGRSIVADPKFANATARDFTLAADSPALKIGFEPFDLSAAGPRK